MANIIAGIITCALWTLVGYILGYDAGAEHKGK